MVHLHLSPTFDAASIHFLRCSRLDSEFRLVPAEFQFNPVVTLYRLAKVQNVVIWNENDTFPTGIRDGVKTYAQYFGMNVTNFTVPSPMSVADAKSLVSKIRAVNPDAIVGATYADACSLLSTEFKNQNYLPQGVAQTDCISDPGTYLEYPATKYFTDKIEYDPRMTGQAWTDSTWYFTEPTEEFVASSLLAYQDMVETLNTTDIHWSVAISSGAGMILTRAVQIAYARLTVAPTPCTPAPTTASTPTDDVPAIEAPSTTPTTTPTSIPSTTPTAAPVTPVATPTVAPVVAPVPVMVPVTPVTPPVASPVPITPPPVAIPVAPVSTPVDPTPEETPIDAPSSSPDAQAGAFKGDSSTFVSSSGSSSHSSHSGSHIDSNFIESSSHFGTVHSLSSSISRRQNAVYVDPYRHEAGQDRRLAQVMKSISKASVRSFDSPKVNPDVHPVVEEFDADGNLILRRSTFASKSIFDFVDTSNVIAALYLINEPSYFGQIGFSVWGQNNVKDTIVIQSDGSLENEIVYPLGSQTKAFIFPAPTFTERQNFVWKYFAKTMEIVFTPIVIICILSSLILMILVVQSSGRKAIRAASPLFLQLILAGSVLLYGSYFAWFTQTTTVMCHLRIWIVALGFFTMFGALLAKTWRIMRIFTSKDLRVFQITDLNLLVVLAAGFTLLIVLLTLFSTIAKPYAKTVVLDALRPATTTEFHCAFENRTANLAILIVLGLFFCFIVCFGAYLSARIWKVPKKQFNESRAIAFCMYNLLIFGALTICLQASGALSTYPMFIVRTTLITASTAFTIIALFAPKFPFLTCYPSDYDINYETTTTTGTGNTTTGNTTYGQYNNRNKSKSNDPSSSSSSTTSSRRVQDGVELPGRFRTVLIFLFPCLPCFSPEERHLVRFHRSRSSGARGNTATDQSPNNTRNKRGVNSGSAGGRYHSKGQSVSQHTPPPPLQTASTTSDDGDNATPMRRIRGGRAGNSADAGGKDDDDFTTSETSSSTTTEEASIPVTLKQSNGQVGGRNNVPVSLSTTITPQGSGADLHADSKKKGGKKKNNKKAAFREHRFSEYDERNASQFSRYASQHEQPAVAEEEIATLQWELERSARKQEKLKLQLKDQKKAIRLLQKQLAKERGEDSSADDDAVTDQKKKSRIAMISAGGVPQDLSDAKSESLLESPPASSRSDSIYSDSDSEDFGVKAPRKDDDDSSSDSESD